MSNNNVGGAQKQIRQPTASNSDDVTLKKQRRENNFKDDNRYIRLFPPTSQEGGHNRILDKVTIKAHSPLLISITVLLSLSIPLLLT